MARSRSGRSASRKSTPVSPPKLVAPTRPTRQNQKNKDAGTSRTLRGASVESDVSTSSRTTRRKGKSTKEAEKLPAVQENVDVEYPNPLQHVELQDKIAEPEDDEMADRFSFISGSTTHTTAERQALDFDVLVDELVNLNSKSTQLLNVFDYGETEDIVNLHNRLQIPASPESVRLTKCIRHFQDIRLQYGTSGYLINPNIVIQVLRKVSSWDEVGNGVWRPDAILQLANLAELTAILFPKHRESQAAMDPLAHLNDNFPGPFMNGFSPWQGASDVPGRSDLPGQTLALGLELRTQYAIKLLVEHEKDTNFDPESIIRLVFYADDRHFRGWDIDSLQAEEGHVPAEFEQLIAERVQSITRHFSTNSNSPVDFAGLDEAFPWTGLLVMLCQWAQLRARELKFEINKRGGADSIEEKLRNGVTLGTAVTSFSGPQAPEQTISGLLPPLALTKTSRSGQKRSSLGSVYKMLDREKELSERQGDSPSRRVAVMPSIALQTADPDDAAEPVIDDDPPVPTQATQASPSKTQRILDRLVVQRRESNKENIEVGPSRTRPRTFADRQPGAQRIDFDSDDNGEIASTAGHAGKRKVVDEDDEDDDFERAPSPAKIQRKDKATASTPRRTAPAPRVEESDYSGTDRGLGGNDDDDIQLQINRQLEAGTALHNASTANHRSPSAVLPPSSSAMSEAREYIERVKQKAKTSTITNNIRTARLTQNRQPYSEAETQRIIELVGEYGTSWTLIKQMDDCHPDGPELGGRTQVQLKDKCRNMAMDFYKGRVRLPVNFENVRLKTVDVEGLRRMGIHI